MLLSALSTMSLSSVQTVMKFTDRIPKIMVRLGYEDYILALIMFLVVCCNGLQGLEMDGNIGQQQDTRHAGTR